MPSLSKIKELALVAAAAVSAPQLASCVMPGQARDDHYQLSRRPDFDNNAFIDRSSLKARKPEFEPFLDRLIDVHNLVFELRQAPEAFEPLAVANEFRAAIDFFEAQRAIISDLLVSPAEVRIREEADIRTMNTTLGMLVSVLEDTRAEDHKWIREQTTPLSYFALTAMHVPIAKVSLKAQK